MWQSSNPTTYSHATTNNMSTRFSNQDGLLSSMTPEQLFRCYVHSGLANMFWDDLCGCVLSCSLHRDGTSSTGTRSGFTGLRSMLTGTNTMTPGIQYVATTGTLLLLHCGGVIQPTEEYCAPGSLGTFDLEAIVQVCASTGTQLRC